MNIVDATDRAGAHDDSEVPSLITIILDTNPHAWGLLEDSFPLSKVVANLLVFINAHLAINHANRVAVLASHSERAEWLYPTPTRPRPHRPATNGDDIPMGGDDDDEEEEEAPNGGPVQPPDDANHYRPFARIQHALTANILSLTASTTPSEFTSTPTTMISGALTLALSHISKQSANLRPGATSTQFNYSDPTSVAAGGNDVSPSSTSAAPSSASALGPSSRILILSVSGDLANQYIPIMNSIFACQRLAIPIDILKLAGDTVFLQQAADVTGGTYMALADAAARAGLLQTLMCVYLPDRAARGLLVSAGGGGGGGGGEGVDFRAACFCHRRVVDVGFVCSICLSIFCEPLGDGVCLTCGSRLSLGDYGRRPAVVPPKKKKKKRRRAVEGVETPGSGAGTPMHV